MKAFNGFRSEAKSAKYPNLPAGPYVARIKGVHVDGDEPDQTLILRLDVCEGEYTDYFLKRYKAEDRPGNKYPTKYRGDYRIRIPNDANTRAQYPESDLKNFNDAIYRIEQSNPDYHWDWQEQGLVGKIVGINMQDREYNGAAYTAIGRLEIAQDVRSGIVGVMPPRGGSTGQNSANNAAPAGYTPVQVKDDELPWNTGSNVNPYF